MKTKKINTISELTIEVNQQCPNKCLFCSSSASRESDILLTSKQILSVAREAKKLGLKRIFLSGGEPLCHQNIFEIMKTFADLTIEPVIYTCGMIFQGLKVIAFKEWERFGHTKPILIFNIQSNDPSVHDFILGHKGAFNMTKKSLLSATGRGFQNEIHIVPNKLNLNALESVVKEFIGLGVSRISFLRLVYQGYARNNYNYLKLKNRDLAKIEKILKHISENTDKSKVRFGIPFSGLFQTEKQCTAGLTKLLVRYDGKVLPCEAFKDAGIEFILGDINNDSLESCLEKGKENFSLNNLRNRVCNTEPCAGQIFHKEESPL